MSRTKNPIEKKRLAYERDHYNRNGESNKAWRKTKPIKKAKARRAFRKASNDLLKVAVAEADEPGAATRKQGSIRQRKIRDWGAMSLRKFVSFVSEKRAESIGAKKLRDALRQLRTPIPIV